LREEVFEQISPIFIVGAPRSGTTLCERILDAHPDIAIADEIIFFDIILKARTVVPELDTTERIRAFFEILPHMDHVRYWHGTEEVLNDVRARLEADENSSYQRFFLYLMEAYARYRGATRCGDKTPWNVRHLEPIVRWFPNARIIHMVRDPRAHIASKRRLPRTSKDVITSTVKWAIDIDAAVQFARSDAATTERFLEIRYEDLVRDPEPVVRQLCRMVDVPFFPGMLDFFRSSEAMFKDQPWKEGVFRPLSASSIERWREELQPAQVLLIELLTAGAMRRYGYEPASRKARIWLALPVQIAREIRLWLQFKHEDRARRLVEKEIRFESGSGNLYRLLLRSVWRQLSGRC
jgi:hypothetical protein